MSHPDDRRSGSSTNLQIRRATPDDALLLATLGARTFEASFGSANRPEDMRIYLDSNFSITSIENQLEDPNSTFLLAYAQGRAIGYALLKQGPAPALVEAPRPVELVRIYVDPDAIGRGYGSALMDACLEQALRTGHEALWLGVWEKNLRAIGFYEKWGFRKLGTQEFILGSDVQTDLVMARSVTPPSG